MLDAIKEKLGLGIGPQNATPPTPPPASNMRVTDVPGVTNTSPLVKGQNALLERRRQLEAIK